MHTFTYVSKYFNWDIPWKANLAAFFETVIQKNCYALLESDCKGWWPIGFRYLNPAEKPVLISILA